MDHLKNKTFSVVRLGYTFDMLLSTPIETIEKPFVGVHPTL